MTPQELNDKIAAARAMNGSGVNGFYETHEAVKETVRASGAEMTFSELSHGGRSAVEIDDISCQVAMVISALGGFFAGVLVTSLIVILAFKAFSK